MVILIFFKPGSLASRAGLRRAVHPARGPHLPQRVRLQRWDVRQYPAPVVQLNAKIWPFLVRQWPLVGQDERPPQWQHCFGFPAWMRGHVSLSQERWGGLQASSEEQEEHWRTGGLRSYCAGEPQGDRQAAGHCVVDLPPLALPGKLITSQHGSAEHGNPVCWSMQTAGISQWRGASGTAPPPRVISVRVHINVCYLAACWLAPIPVLGRCGDACPLSTQKHDPGSFSMAGLPGFAVQAATVVPCLFFS